MISLIEESSFFGNVVLVYDMWFLRGWNFFSPFAYIAYHCRYRDDDIVLLVASVMNRKDVPDRK